MVDPVSTKQLTSILKIKHFKNKLSCLFDFSIFMDLVSLQIFAGNMRPEIKKTNTKLCLADGGVINTMGYIDLPIQVGNFTTVQKFTVADIDVPAVRFILA
jgi:hypothetical protein